MQNYAIQMFVFLFIFMKRICIKPEFQYELSKRICKHLHFRAVVMVNVLAHKNAKSANVRVIGENREILNVTKKIGLRNSVKVFELINLC